MMFTNFFVRTMNKYFFIFFLCLLSVSTFAQSRYIPESTKKIVYTRDGGSCRCCGSFENLEFDHIIPYSCGGNSDISNIQLLCISCNRSKSNGCYCKIHDKKVGVNCCQGNVSSESNSSREAKQCAGKTQKGDRCKNKIVHSSGLCHHHRN